MAKKKFKRNAAEVTPTVPTEVTNTAGGEASELTGAVGSAPSATNAELAAGQSVGTDAGSVEDGVSYVLLIAIKMDAIFDQINGAVF